MVNLICYPAGLDHFYMYHPYMEGMTGEDGVFGDVIGDTFRLKCGQRKDNQEKKFNLQYPRKIRTTLFPGWVI